MSKGNKQAIFSKFSLKARKQKKTQKQAIEQAKEFSRQMEEGKKKARQDFMNKLLQKCYMVLLTILTYICYTLKNDMGIVHIF